MMKYIQSVIVVCVLICVVAIVINFYGYIFSRNVEGIVENIEKVQLNVALMQTTGGTGEISPQMYSYSVGIKEKSGEIVTASAEDRQWGVPVKGQCLLANYYPYPPWELNKAGTYHNARLLKLWECGSEAAKETY